MGGWTCWIMSGTICVKKMTWTVGWGEGREVQSAQAAGCHGDLCWCAMGDGLGQTISFDLACNRRHIRLLHLL
jgi:hypothetical protein